MTSGGSARSRRNSAGVDRSPAATSCQPPSTRTRPAQRWPSSAAAQAATIAAVAVSGEHDPSAVPAQPSAIDQPGALGDRDDVVGQRGRVVLGGRGVRQAVAAQVDGDGPDEPPEPARHGGPGPGGPGQPVDQEDAGSAAAAGPAPVEEVDPLAGRELDDEALRLGGRGRAAARARRGPSAVRSIGPRIRGSCPNADAVPAPPSPADGAPTSGSSGSSNAPSTGSREPFQAALDEVAIVIEDDATDEQLDIAGLGRDDALYGLYEGTPRTAWGADLVPFPNKISLFRIPLEEDFPDPDDLADEVRVTVIHELAHHLGIDDDRLEELGLE